MDSRSLKPRTKTIIIRSFLIALILLVAQVAVIIGGTTICSYLGFRNIERNLLDWARLIYTPAKNSIHAVLPEAWLIRNVLLGLAIQVTGMVIYAFVGGMLTFIVSIVLEKKRNITDKKVN